MYEDNVTTRDGLKAQFASGDNHWLYNIELKVWKSFGYNYTLFSGIGIYEKRKEEIIINDGSFVLPVSSYNFQLSWRNNLKDFFCKRYMQKFRILGIKTCMVGGEAQGVYQKRNQKTIEQIGFEELFKKEQVIIAMMINQSVEPDKPGGYIKSLSCECIANRDFHLFLCGEKFIFKQGNIIKTIALRNKIFNCIQNNDPEKDKFHWVGKIDKEGVAKVYDELRGSFS